MKHRTLALALIAATAAAAQAAEPPPFEEILKKAEARFVPAKARPGQTVTLKVDIELLKGWHTYPLVQPDKAARSQTNRIVFPTGMAILYVDKPIDPPDPKEKAEPDLAIDRMLYYPEGGVWERKAVVLPSVKAGKHSSKIKFVLLVCDKDNCLPPKTLELQADLEVAGDPVQVDSKYQAEVDKATTKE